MKNAQTGKSSSNPSIIPGTALLARRKSVIPEKIEPAEALRKIAERANQKDGSKPTELAKKFVSEILSYISGLEIRAQTSGQSEAIKQGQEAPIALSSLFSTLFELKKSLEEKSAFTARLDDERAQVLNAAKDEILLRAVDSLLRLNSRQKYLFLLKLADESARTASDFAKKTGIND